MKATNISFDWSSSLPAARDPGAGARAARILSGLALRQPPSGSDEMAGVPVGIAFEIVLMFRFRFPEIADRRDFGGCLSRPNSRRIDIGDGVAGHALLLRAGKENGRTIAQADVVALAIAGGGIVDLKKEFEKLPVAQKPRIENDLDRFRMSAVVAIGGVRNVAARIADAGGNDAGHFSDQVLHAPKATSGKNGALGLLGHVCSPFSVDAPLFGVSGGRVQPAERLVVRPARGINPIEAGEQMM